MSDTVVKSIKVIRLGHSPGDKPHLLKVAFSSTEETFDIIKNKKQKTFTLNSSLSINIRTDRIDHQRAIMRKFHEELSSHKFKRESGITIKFIKSIPTTVKESSIHHNQHF